MSIESISCCDSPQKEFTVRNDGCEPLANDTRVTVTLPAGGISAEGIDEIRHYVYERLVGGDSRASKLYHAIPGLGDAWQAKEGNYPKRLSHLAYAKFGIKLSPEIISRVGNMARDHSGSQKDYCIETTRRLNMSDRDFGNAGSCWWGGGGYGTSRCTFKTNGGFGLRTFNMYGVAGRAWVMPLRIPSVAHQPVPTFNTETPDAFIVFNGYGDLAGYTAPRIMAHMAGWTYHKIGFACNEMYVNSGGYLVAPEDIVKRFAADGFRLDARQHSNLFDAEQAEAAQAALSAERQAERARAGAEQAAAAKRADKNEKARERRAAARAAVMTVAAGD